MKKLDRSKHFSRVTPPWDGEGEFDRPAHTEQDGSYFDAQDREIIAGQPLKEERTSSAGTKKKGGKGKAAKTRVVEPEPEPDEDDEEEDEGTDEEDDQPEHGMTAAQVLKAFELKEITWPVFQKEAKRVLGGECPAGKEAIQRALMDAAAKGKAHKAAPERGTKKPDPTGSIDLVAWGTGQKDYLFDDVRKALRARYDTVVTDRRAAVEALLNEGLITGDAARKDV